jgi:hypothetical protein
MRWAVNVARIGNNINTYRILVGEHEGNNRFEDLGADVKIILKMDLKETGREDVDWIRLGQDT